MSHRLVILFLLFWLPLQGWGVSVMPYCRQGGIMWMRAVAAAEQTVNSEDMSCCPHHPHHDNSTTQNGDGCGLCHLANAPAAIVVARLFAPITGDATLPAITLDLPDTVPDSLYRPPRG